MLCYRGAPSVSWLLRGDQKEDPRVHVSSCRNSTRQSCSMLVMRRVTANDTGYFTCVHDDSPTDEDLMARIYVFVKGKNFTPGFATALRQYKLRSGWDLC